MRERGIVGIDATFQMQQRTPDFRRYEIKDHLGNVRTVIADYKNPFVKSGAVSNWTYLADVKNISNMYPYGKSYGTNAIYNAAEDYRYGFNGMEKEKNMDTSGDITDFGARVFDANFPVFLSRDPKEGFYPDKSTYNFASSTPINAIDFNGESSYFIMGTNWDLDINKDSRLRNTINYLHEKLSTSTGKVNYEFDWSDQNAILNSFEHWEIAAERLADKILKDYKENGGDDITLFGYSYGGAVAIIAADIVYQRTEGKVLANVVTIVTPSNNYEGNEKYNNYVFSYNSLANEVYKMEMRKRLGNPKFSKGINDMIHFYLLEDDVAGFAAFDDYYTSPKVKNYVLLSNDAPWNDGIWNKLINSITSHTDIPFEKDIFEKTIEKNNIGKMEKVRGDDANKKTK